MGGWKLEVYRMTLYVAFPVGCFLLFNYPPFYEQAILDARRALARCYDPEGADLLKQFLRKNQADQMEQTLKNLKSEKTSR